MRWRCSAFVPVERVQRFHCPINVLILRENLQAPRNAPRVRWWWQFACAKVWWHAGICACSSFRQLSQEAPPQSTCLVPEGRRIGGLFVHSELAEVEERLV